MKKPYSSPPPAVELKSKSWFNKEAYPFTSHYFSTNEGRMHYIDEGKGDPIVFIHGTPSWSFLYRHLIKKFSATHRCLAIDHLGFGLSDKPAQADYRPQAHARRLEQWLQQLELKDITLVVHDFGGPIGLSYALRHPEKIARVVIANSWLWSLEHEASFRKADKMLNSWLGKFLYLQVNLSPKVLFKEGIAKKDKFSKDIHRHYIKVFPSSSSRHALYQIALSLLGASSWYQELKQQLPRLKEKPVLLLWGMKDKYFNPTFLERWQQLLADPKTVYLQDAGHFIQEDAAEQIEAAIATFVQKETPA
ncbi:alpha/beta fold hydrolase [Nafulsella turpanensis]|uniref:alpha/beta fold hydrolase n=1 Tax=Nafulsella turpanensis TaxID=1265690 RepID=UPI000346DA4A|nr:alpha/beta fold hydrolase [Nafulsella turpanensis]